MKLGGRKPKRDTVAAWLGWARKSMPPLDAELIALFNFGGGEDRSWLVAHMDDEISEKSLEKADRMASERMRGMPLAYLIGIKDFYGRSFDVTPDVLIPRVETEELIDLVKELDLPAQARMLDVGTGSGCIAVTLALEFPQADVYACDVSLDALGVAEGNDLKHEARVKLVKSNLLKSLDLGKNKNFDVIVANLPYVNPAWDWLDIGSLEFEPTVALFAMSENGLSVYRRLFEDLESELAKTKYLVLEADPCQHDDLVRLAKSYRWKLYKQSGFGLVFVGAKG